MTQETIRYKNLSGWLKFAFIWTLIQAGCSVLYFLIYALIGITLLTE